MGDKTVRKKPFDKLLFVLDKLPPVPYTVFKVHSGCAPGRQRRHTQKPLVPGDFHRNSQ